MQEPGSVTMLIQGMNCRIFHGLLVHDPDELDARLQFGTSGI